MGSRLLGNLLLFPQHRLRNRVNSTTMLPRSWRSLPLRRRAERGREKMLWYVEARKPAAIRRREIVDCCDEDLDCLIAGIHFDANLRVFKI
jgi:hypothetical protein